MRNKIEEATFVNINFFYFSSFIWKDNHALIEEDINNHLEKIMIAEEELDGIDIVDIANFVGLLRLAFTNEECGNIKVFVDGGELAGNINQKNTSDVLKTCRCSLCDKC